MLTVCSDKKCLSEKKYILDILLTDFLGLNYRFLQDDSPGFRITAAGSSRELFLDAAFFQKAESEWLKKESLPEPSLKYMELPAELSDILAQKKLPVFYCGDTDAATILSGNQDRLKIQFDLFGSAFFMLSRYEEAVTGARDKHGRFDAKESVAWKEKLLERPLVNEYLELLWYSLSRLWPALERKKRCFSFQFSHDVDKPYAYYYQKLFPYCRRILGQLKNKQIGFSAFIKELNGIFKVKTRGVAADPYNTFEWILSLYRDESVSGTFYFITEPSDPFIDCDYDIRDEQMRRLLKRISQQGQRIGLHPSYFSFNKQERITHELEKLKKVCTEEQITQGQWPNRQHYLRFELPDFWTQLEEAGFSSDSSLGYADHVGFRSGCCYPFSVYDLRSRKHLKLVENPLIVMEWSVMGASYMNIRDENEVYAVMEKMVKICARYGGCFTLLWHNHLLAESKHRDIFERLLGCCVRLQKEGAGTDNLPKLTGRNSV